MIWHKGQFLYRGRILNTVHDLLELREKKKITRYAMPVPGGRIVDFTRKENEHNIDMYYALYKVNVCLKEKDDHVRSDTPS